MPHVDEGTLHALLDGELGPEALAEVRVHFATCPSCAARLDEARQLLAETERLVSALELPNRTAPPRPAREGESGGSPRPATVGVVADTLMPSSPGSPQPILDPVVLIPENPTVREIRRSRMRVLGWAAGLLVVVGAGALGVTRFQEMPRNTDGRLRLSPDEFTTAPPREGSASPDSAPTLALGDSEAAASRPAPPSPAAAPAASAPDSKPAARPEQQRAAPVPPPARALAAAPAPAPAPAPTPAPGRAAAGGARADSGLAAKEEPEELQLAKAAEAAPQDAATRGEAAGAAESRPESVNRSGAAQATSELDRRRIRERAAAATAALEQQLAQRRAAEERERQLSAQREAATVTPAAAAAPQPSADPRTGISSRIGLDEAARQLGGPMHAIDGIPRQTVGLVPGTSVDGADPARPVVRAVYADQSGRLLFLDQQMAQPGDGPATPETGRGGRQMWVKDGVLLVLHADGLSADSLRSLARRVR